MTWCAKSRWLRFGMCAVGLCLLAPPSPLAAQEKVAGNSAALRHTPVCAEGVRRYDGMAAVPAPFDTLSMPPGEQLRATNPVEAKAAERQMVERAGSVGATGIGVTEQATEEAGVRRVQRRVIPVFVPADTTRAQAACRTGSGAASDSANSRTHPQ